MQLLPKAFGLSVVLALVSCGPSNKGTGDGGGSEDCGSRCTSFGWEECISPGEWADPVVCAEDEFCINADGCVTCIPDVRYCGGDGQDLYLCNEDGTEGEKVGRCPDGEVCSNGFCKDRCSKAEDEPSNVGCHFWAVDLDNEAFDMGFGGTLGSNDAAAAQYAVVIANNSYVPAEAKVYINTANVGEAVNEQLVKTVAVPARGLAQIDLDQREVDGSMGQNGSYTQNSGSGTFVSPHAYRIETNEPVVAYQFNPIVQQFSNDASILIPRQALGDHYYILGYPTANPCGIDIFPQDSVPDHTSITVIGTQDNTQVTVTPTHPIMASSGPSGIAIPATPAGTPLTFTINQYDVVNLESDQPVGDVLTCISLAMAQDGDFSGSEVSSTKPVAVFSSVERGVGTGGIEIPYAPDWDTEEKDNCCTDHLEQQMFPTEALGWKFAVSRSPIRSTDTSWAEPDIYRVVGTVDGTTITTNLGGNFGSFTLNAGEWKAFYASHGFTLEATGGAVMLGQFLISQGLIPQGRTGDPTFVMFPAAEQHRKDYTFLVPTTFSSNYMVLAKPQNAAISIDEQPLEEFNNCTTGVVGVVNGITYDQITCPMTEGVHSVSASKPFGLTVYGYYSAGSYGYPGGSDVKLINPID